jgi:hypothetical protein
MKNLKTLTLILLAASTLFATSCKEVTEEPTTNQTQDNKFVGDWSLTKMQAIFYDSATNAKLGEESMPLTDTWTFTNSTITGSINGDAFNMSYTLPSATVMRAGSLGEMVDLDILNQTTTSFQLRNTDYDDGEKYEIIYHFTKK